MLALALLLPAFLPPPSGLDAFDTAAPVERRVYLMGTTFDLVVLLPDRTRALAASEEGVEEVSRVEERLSTWREGGPLDRVNRAAPGEEVVLDPELYALLSDVFRWSERTGRAFDPTVLPLVRAWDLRGAGRIPTRGEISAALRSTGTGRFRLDPQHDAVARLDRGAGLDEGAWGKGYALDRAASRLRAAGIADAWLDLGGEVLALGNGPGGAAWKVPIGHPRDRRRPELLLAVGAGLAVSTSGDSERSRLVGGRSVGHLLDPRTGRPAADFGSVSVIAPSAYLADVLSTAFFVLGPRDGLALSAKLRAEGFANEAVFLVDHGGAIEVLPSPGMSRLILATESDAVAGVRGREVSP
jgi:thiamine biosynthesis lipoprotein